MIRLYELFFVAGVLRSIDIDMLLRVRRLSVLVLLLRGETNVLKNLWRVRRPRVLFCVKFLMPYLKGPKHEIFGSRFITPSNPILVSDFRIERKN